MNLSATLKGYRIVTTAINVPGPVAAARLTAMGAQLTKVEPPHGDPLRSLSPAWYEDLVQGQSVSMLDLKNPADREQFHSLLSQTDLLLTASRPAALKRLGLDWESLHAQCPRLCHTAIIGYPPPRENVAGHDLTYLAPLGLLQPPQMPATLLADLAGAERAVAASLELLLRRERTGCAGQSLVSLQDAAHSFASPLRHGVTAPDHVLGGGLPGYRMYEAADGFVAVAALEAHFLARLEHALGVSPATHEALEPVFRSRTASAWEALGAEADIPIVAVRR